MCRINIRSPLLWRNQYLLIRSGENFRFGLCHPRRRYSFAARRNLCCAPRRFCEVWFKDIGTPGLYRYSPIRSSNGATAERVLQRSSSRVSVARPGKLSSGYRQQTRRRLYEPGFGAKLLPLTLSSLRDDK